MTKEIESPIDGNLTIEKSKKLMRTTIRTSDLQRKIRQRISSLTLYTCIEVVKKFKEKNVYA
jgi:hypothetical protein